MSVNKHSALPIHENAFIHYAYLDCSCFACDLQISQVAPTHKQTPVLPLFFFFFFFHKFLKGFAQVSLHKLCDCCIYVCTCVYRGSNRKHQRTDYSETFRMVYRMCGINASTIENVELFDPNHIQLKPPA